MVAYVPASTWLALARRWLQTAGHERLSQVPLLVRGYVRTGLLSMARGMNAKTDRIDRALAGVRCAVLIVRGRNDVICHATWAAFARRGYPGGAAETLFAGAHIVPVTYPAPLGAGIMAYIGKRPMIATRNLPLSHRR